ncbi:hypothetical protein IV203_005220 [Nitzschia inconspicua]|uniref:Uncharacterized protein n=1 Tax=Nitzschia inconspicua TaxID=303405 RepID=A0A9K3PFX0_9STRA|nr:hypothetical protein IV203_005220 [Nitzschia inconspicua]
MKEDDSRVVVEEQAQDQRTWERSPKRMKWCMVGVAVLLLVTGKAVSITMCLNHLRDTDEEGTTSGFIVVAPTPDLVVTSCGPYTVVPGTEPPSIPTTNDSCEGGATLLDFSTATPGITGLSSNVPNELCGARGVPTDTGAWYSYVGGGTLTTVTTCSSEGDVIPSVYTSNCVCVEEIERYAGFEEAGTWTTSYDCPSNTKRSAVSWYSVAEEEYHIWVHDLDVDASRFEIVVRRMRRMSSRRLSRSSNND